MSLSDIRLIEFPEVSDPRGSLAFVEARVHVPFNIERVYYLYDVPAGGVRGGHAHKDLQQLIIAVSGSFEVEVDDGFSSRTYQLNRPCCGLYLPSMIWRELKGFSAGSVCLVVASAHYDEADYYRSYKEFTVAARGGYEG